MDRIKSTQRLHHERTTPLSSGPSWAFHGLRTEQASKYITTHDLVRVLRFLKRPTKLDGQTDEEMVAWTGVCASTPAEEITMRYVSPTTVYYS